MKIGVFDSGLGGLAIAQAIIERLPEYDYVYLGDTKRVPYGNRSQETIHEFVAEALDYLFGVDCKLVVLACNTASAEALRKSQQVFVPERFPGRNVLGVLIPAAEAAVESGAQKVGVIATASTIESGSYEREVMRLAPNAEVRSLATPLLVPLVECDGIKYAGAVLDDYLAMFANEDLDALILGCTHYCHLKDLVRQRVKCRVISQDEIVPQKLAVYLHRHPEIEVELGRNGSRDYLVTDLTPGYQGLVRKLTGVDLDVRKVAI